MHTRTSIIDFLTKMVQKSKTNQNRLLATEGGFFIPTDLVKFHKSYWDLFLNFKYLMIFSTKK